MAADFEVDELGELSLDELEELEALLSDDELDLSDELELSLLEDDFSAEPLPALPELFADSRLSVR